MRTREEIAREVADRNVFRTENGLPLVKVTEEVKKIYEAELDQDFVDWCKTYPLPLQAKIKEEVLQEERRWRGDPNWIPTGWLSGGGAGYSSRVRERLQQIWKEEREKCPSS